MKKPRHFSKAYEAYKAEFQANRKKNNIKRGVRQLTKKQYESFRNEGYSTKDILDQQKILKSRRMEQRVWKHYQKLNLKPGEQSVYDNSYWGENWDSESGELDSLNMHRSLKTLMKDRHALHFMITQVIDELGDRDEALAYFGY